MRKKTALQNPGNRKASPKQTKGLVAKDQKPQQSAQEECAPDNRSHRTFLGCRRGPTTRPFAAPIRLAESVLLRRPSRSWAMCHWSERSERKRHPCSMGKF